MAGRIEGYVMVHCTDSAGGSMGQVGSGGAAICRRAERCLPASLAFASARFLRAGNNGCRLLMTAIRAVRAIYPKPLTR